MATYAIGDIQGCFDALLSLLEKIAFDPKKDTLWFVGDLVNRGDKSLETLRYIKNLGDSAICVLGNHDLALLALSVDNKKLKRHTMHDILQAPDRNELIHWLRHRPLLHHDKKLGYTMVHAGLPPQWTLKTARHCAKELEKMLQSDKFSDFMAKMFGNEPKKWHKSLSGWDRLRFITNTMTRMRYCKADGTLSFTDNGPLGTQQSNCIPWYEAENRKNAQLKIIFGHWSTLFGHASHPNVYPLDTGCLWGSTLTAMRLGHHRTADDKPCYISVDCEARSTIKK